MDDLMTYDVALWRNWPSNALPYVGDMTATSPLLAALALIQYCKLKRVAYVAVAAPDGVITRYTDGLSLYTEESPDSEELEVAL